MNHIQRILTGTTLALTLIAPAGAWDRDDNPPGPIGGPGTNWENPPGPVGGPGTSPDRRPGHRHPRRRCLYWRLGHPIRDWCHDRDDNPPGPIGGPGTNWENPPGPRGGPGASPNRWWRWH